MKKKGNFRINERDKEFIKKELEKIGGENIQFVKTDIYFENKDFIPFLLREEDNGLELVLCSNKKAPQKTMPLKQYYSKEIEQGIRRLMRGVNKYDYMDITTLYIEYKRLKEMYKILVKLTKDMSRVIKESKQWL